MIIENNCKWCNADIEQEEVQHSEMLIVAIASGMPEPEPAIPASYYHPIEDHLCNLCHPYFVNGELLPPTIYEYIQVDAIIVLEMEFPKRATEEILDGLHLALSENIVYDIHESIDPNTDLIFGFMPEYTPNERHDIRKFCNDNHLKHVILQDMPKMIRDYVKKRV